MLRLSLFLVAMLASFSMAISQTARLQIIHNSPEPTVDIYVNGTLFEDDFEFRTATAFADVPAGVPLSVAIAPGNSMSVNDAIATYPLTLDDGVTYVVTASGIVGNMMTPFDLIVDNMGQETSTDPSKVALHVLHGSPNAPAVDVVVRAGGTLVGNLSYGEGAGYVEVDPGVYYIDIKPAGMSDIVATFEADLSGLAGGAARVFASGLLGGNPGFGLYAALPDGAVVELPATQVARVQVIHNSPAPTVDVYANDALLIDDFAFRTAEEFMFVPAGVDIALGIAPGNSNSVNDTITSFTVNLENGKTYAVTASGIVGNMMTPFTLLVDDMAIEAANDPSKVALHVLHGSPNAPAVDVVVRTVGTLVGNISYGEGAGYVEVDPGVYYIDIKPAGTSDIVATFEADLSGLAGGAARVFASGLLGSSPAFGLYAALPDGTVVELPVTQVARVQVIHNSPDPTVDVYANDALLIDDFEFRTAEEFMFVPAGVDITLGIAPGNSNSVNDTITSFTVNLENGKTYAVTASGIVGNMMTPFTLLVDDMAIEAATDPSKVALHVLHGSPNAPAVDVVVRAGGTLVGNLSYGEGAGYVEVDPGVYYIDIKPAGMDDIVATFEADLSGLAGGAARVFASGLLGGNPGFGLYAALPDGTVVELPSTQVARVQVIHNSPEPTVDIYANDALFIDDFEFRTAEEFMFVPAGVDITLGIALGNSNSVNDTITSFTVNLENGKTYAVTASGIVGDMMTPFTLLVDDMALEAANDTNVVSFNLLHGSTNAPAIDVRIPGLGTIVNNFAYTNSTPYLDVAPGVYYAEIIPSGTSDVLVTYKIDVTSLKGQSARIFASGLIGGSPAFGLYAALADGTVIELPAENYPTARVQVIHNSPSPTVDVYAGSELLIDDFEFRTATPFIDLIAETDIRLSVAPGNSNSVDDAIAGFDVFLEEGETYTVTAAGVVGNMMTPFNLYVDAGIESSPAGTTSVSVFHGSPDAPNVDVDERVAGNLIGDLAFGEYTTYLELPSADYILDIKAANTDPIVATYLAPLSLLDGQAIRVIASGYLNDMPGFGLFAVLPDGTVIELPSAPVSRVQIVHNSPSPTVDIYVNGDNVLPNFEFRTATSFGYLPADANLNIGIAPANSQSVNDTIVNFPVTLVNGESYIVIANGIVGDPTTPFTLDIVTDAREAAVDPSQIELNIFHGSPTAPAVDAVPFGGGPALVSNLSYGESTGYVGLPPADYFLDIVPNANPYNAVGTYGAGLTQLPGLSGLVLASGLPGDDPEFGLFLVLPNGAFIPLPSFARVQVVHNSPEPTVDVYLDSDVLLEDFAFREATPVALLAAGQPFTLGVAPGNSSSVNDTIYSLSIPGLSTGKMYTIMAAGVVGDPTTPFDLYINDQGRYQSSTGSGVELNFFHGSPDAPAVDVQVQGGTPILFDDTAFGEFADYVNVPANNYIVEVTPANDNSNVLLSRIADLSGIDGQSATVFASGFFASGDPIIEVWVALANGVTFPLTPFVDAVNVDPSIQSLTISPNPVVDLLQVNVELEEARALRFRIRDISGRLVQEGDFGSVNQGRFFQAINLEGNVTPGMYLFELVSDQGVNVKKIIVQK